MYDLSKLCSDKLCKSAFQKSLAKTKKKQNRKITPPKKQASKRSQYTTLLKMNCVWAVITTARIKLKAD